MLHVSSSSTDFLLAICNWVYRPASMPAEPSRFLQLVLSRKLFSTHITIPVAIAEPRRKCGVHESFC
jgi:hypothetical protein